MEQCGIETSAGAIAWHELSAIVPSDDLGLIMPMIMMHLDQYTLSKVPYPWDRLQIEFEKIEAENCFLKKEAKCIIERLASQKKFWGVLCNGPFNKQWQKICNVGLDSYLTCEKSFIACDNIKYPIKPNPFSLCFMLRQNNISRSDALYVGDRVSDIITANLAQVKSVKIQAKTTLEPPHVAPRSSMLTKPTHTIHELKDLLSIIT